MILDELSKVSAGWANKSQPELEEANIVALGSTASSYTIRLKNGAQISNVSGPEGLSVGNAIALGSYPGRAKQRVILQKSAGGYAQTPTVIGV